MSRIWIIGTGRFGWHAVRFLSNKNRDTRFVLVDDDAANLARAQGPNPSLEHADGVAYLAQHLQTEQAKSNLLVSTACRCHGVVTAWNILDG